MYTTTAKIHLGLFCGDVVQAIKLGAFKWNIQCEHQKGPGWFSADHHFRFTHKDEKYLNQFIQSLKEWLIKLQ